MMDPFLLSSQVTKYSHDWHNSDSAAVGTQDDTVLKVVKMEILLGFHTVRITIATLESWVTLKTLFLIHCKKLCGLKSIV